MRQFEEQFESFAASDFRLRAGSPWRGAGTDGRDLGASFTETRGPVSLGPDSQLMALTMQPPLHRRLEMNKEGRGFASMDRTKQREIASKGAKQRIKGRAPVDTR